MKNQSGHPRQTYPSILWKGWRHTRGIQSSYSAGICCSSLARLPSSTSSCISFLNIGEPPAPSLRRPRLSLCQARDLRNWPRTRALRVPSSATAIYWMEARVAIVCRSRGRQGTPGPISFFVGARNFYELTCVLGDASPAPLSWRALGCKRDRGTKRRNPRTTPRPAGLISRPHW